MPPDPSYRPISRVQPARRRHWRKRALIPRTSPGERVQCYATVWERTPDGERTGVSRRCKNRAVAGLRVCRTHGAKMSQVVRLRKENEALAEWEEILRRLGTPVEVDPKKALLDALYAAFGELYALQLMIQEYSARSARTPSPESGRPEDDTPFLGTSELGFVNHAETLVCVQESRLRGSQRSAAGSFYRSTLFAHRKRYAAMRGLPYVVYYPGGIATPTQIIKPYTQAVSDLPTEAQSRVAEEAATSIAKMYPGYVVELHGAGPAIRRLEEALEGRSIVCSRIEYPSTSTRDQTSWYETRFKESVADDGADPTGMNFAQKLERYEETQTRVARLAKLALDAGLEERLVRVAENQAVQVVAVIRQALIVLRLSPADEKKFLTAVATGMRTLELVGDRTVSAPLSR